MSSRYSILTSTTLNVTEGWDDKNSDLLTTLGQFELIQFSEDDVLEIDSTFWTSFQFDQTVPTGAIIVSVKAYVEHYEDPDFLAGELTWEIGTGSLSSLTVLGSTIPTVLETQGAGSDSVPHCQVQDYDIAASDTISSVNTQVECDLTGSYNVTATVTSGASTGDGQQAASLTAGTPLTVSVAISPSVAITGDACNVEVLLKK